MKKRKKINIKALYKLIIISILIVIGLYTLIGHFILNKKTLKIELIGDENITIGYNENYVDAGAKAYYGNEEITEKIDVDTDLDIKTIGNYEYVYIVNFKKQNKKIKRNIKVVDTIKPEITLNGSNNIVLYIGDKYEEKGYKAIDGYDGDITENIKIDGNVDVNKKGKYEIKYSVADSSQNSAVVTRNVEVKERETDKTVDKLTGSVIPSSDTSKNDVIGYSSKGYKIEKKDGLTYVNGVVVVNKTYSLPKDYNLGLTKDFTNNFNNMKKAASESGITLTIVSGFRSYSTQERLYNNYANRDGKAAADTYSARPGHSEHQLGLAADLNTASSSDHFENTKEFAWLMQNCYKYGFILRYLEGKQEITGYKYEPWHYRYVGEELATKLYNGGKWIALEEYLGITSKY